MCSYKDIHLQKAASPAPNANCWWGSNIGRGHNGSGGGDGHIGGAMGWTSIGLTLSSTSTSEEDSLPNTFSTTLWFLGSSRCPYILAKNFRGEDGRGAWTGFVSVWWSSTSSVIFIQYVLSEPERYTDWQCQVCTLSINWAPPTALSLIIPKRNERERVYNSQWRSSLYINPPPEAGLKVEQSWYVTLLFYNLFPTFPLRNNI